MERAPIKSVINRYGLTTMGMSECIVEKRKTYLFFLIGLFARNNNENKNCYPTEIAKINNGKGI